MRGHSVSTLNDSVERVSTPLATGRGGAAGTDGVSEKQREWASATRAYENLSPQLQNFFAALTAVHDFRHGFKESLAEPGGRERLADAISANPPVEHPVVRTHPETGKKSLYVNALFATHIKELEKLESERMLHFLYQHIGCEEHTVRLSWAPYTVAIWDNRSTQHKPVNDFFPQHRKMHRVTIRGDRPA